MKDIPTSELIDLVLSAYSFIGLPTLGGAIAITWVGSILITKAVRWAFSTKIRVVDRSQRSNGTTAIVFNDQCERYTKWFFVLLMLAMVFCFIWIAWYRAKMQGVVYDKKMEIQKTIHDYQEKMSKIPRPILSGMEILSGPIPKVTMLMDAKYLAGC